MNRCRVATIAVASLLPISSFAANPFLEAKDDRPVSAMFRGTEWSDDIDEEEIPLTARVITTRVGETPWAAIFKIEFRDLKSHAKNTRQIPPDYFIVTDQRIVLLNEEDNDAAVKKISALDKAPTFEDRDVRAITSGKLNYEEGPWTTAIEIKGNECIYLASHNSGHFTKIVWKKGIGLVEYASGYGAHADGFRLKRQK
jgi:hypothetical protein